MSNVIGVDPSLTGTGICVLDEKGEILFVKTLSNKNRGMKRIDEILKEILEVISRYSVQVIGIEGYGFGCRGQSIFNLAELGGVLRHTFYVKNYKYYDIPPTRLKKWVSGKGNAKKDLMLLATFKKYNIDNTILKDDNQVDSFGLAKLIFSFNQFLAGKKDFNEYELSVLKELAEE